MNRYRIEVSGNSYEVEAESATRAVNALLKQKEVKGDTFKVVPLTDEVDRKFTTLFAL